MKQSEHRNKMNRSPSNSQLADQKNKIQKNVFHPKNEGEPSQDPDQTFSVSSSVDDTAQKGMEAVCKAQILPALPADKKPGQTDSQDSICEIVHDLLPLYTEGLASPASVLLIEKHLESCPDCTIQLRTLQEAEPKIQSSLADHTLTCALKKTHKAMRRNHILLTVLLVFCLALGSILAWSSYQNVRMNADDVYIASQNESGKNQLTLELKTTSPKEGFLSSSVQEVENGIYTVDLYGGAGLFDQSKTMELSFTQPVHEIRVGEELIYQDGQLITAMCRFFAPYLNGEAKDIQQMQLSRPSFTIDNKPLQLHMEADTKSSPAIWTWKIENGNLNDIPEPQLQAYKDTALIALALTQNLKEIRIQGMDGQSVVFSREELGKYLTNFSSDSKLETEAELQILLNALHPVAG